MKNTDKIDHKRSQKELYMPKNEPMFVDVPEMRFATFKGKGRPDSDEFIDAIGPLYSVAYTIKMKFKDRPDYREYTVMPLEGLWGTDQEPDGWEWMLMIRQPDFVTQELFEEAIGMVKAKDPKSKADRIELKICTEGPSVQMMHIGPYSEEGPTLAKLREYAESIGMCPRIISGYCHREIYMSDPNKTASERLKTVIRIPVERKPVS